MNTGIEIKKSKMCKYDTFISIKKIVMVSLPLLFI
jgi:hypothetical protein